ncbi:hypothetical protein Y032_0160g3359 [Ancylostoma ceylanicum]|uniref:Uncharacterized protein n=1 Tax=Ancylostoma ceylanicum TaxID=53326 RepID=A0A016SXG1_9BILA|nr:hypothetical protein Y032_0160g3359 [Ancylostoma ceylanicum]
MPSRLHIYCISIVFHVVVSDLGLLTLEQDPDIYVEKLCGTHPLTSVLEKIGTKPFTHRDIVKMLARIRMNYPKLWKGYQMALTKCVCSPIAFTVDSF